MSTPRFNFTKAAIDALPVPGKDDRGRSTRTTHWDEKVRGLQLRVTSLGAKTFSVFRWFKGSAKPERVTLGRYPELSIEQARVKAQQVLALLASGENPNELARKNRDEMAFADLFEQYMERHAKLRKRTWRDDISKYRQYLASNSSGIDIASKRLSTVTRNTIATLHSKIGKSHPITANRVLALVRSIFGRAIEWGLFEKANPAGGIKPFQERSRDRFLQSDELPRFFAALAKELNPTARDFLYLSLLTGARRGNVLAMRWEHVNFDQAEWRIPDVESKNGSAQVVLLTPEVMQILAKRKTEEDSPFVFPSRSKCGHFMEPRKAWERMLDTDELDQVSKLLERTGHHFAISSGEPLLHGLQKARKLAHDHNLDTTGCRMSDLRIHDLRRTMGSWQAKTGASLVVIGKSLGHKSQAATQVYARLDKDPVRQSVARATQAMLGAAGLIPSRARSV